MGRAPTMILYELLSLLDVIAPLRFAEPWDNTGLLTGDPDATITRVLLTIDLTHAVADEAIAERYELCVAYHPILFEPIKRVHHDSRAHGAASRCAATAVCSPTAVHVFGPSASRARIGAGARSSAAGSA